MSNAILNTKLYIPKLQPRVILRPRLVARLNEGWHCKLTLISAPAGFGKTTVAGEWITGCQQPVAWLSLDNGDNDPTRFLTYLVASLQTIAHNIGKSVLNILQIPQPPSMESMLTTLLNEITTIENNFALVLDDYHVIDAKSIDNALTFLLEHLPPQMHLVIVTREDPRLPLARLRSRSQLNELRAADLRFTSSETADFLNQKMGQKLSAEDIALLEKRTEGWIAGLQLAAISMQGHKDTTGFIHSFSGSHHFVMDYLVTEVLQQQSESVQTFLLSTSILERLCGSLCDAILPDSPLSGQDTLEYLQQANLFIIPLDNERRWYRYHHLFAELLRQRLYQNSAKSANNEGWDVAELHTRACIWYENNDLELEAFQHAAAANDVDHAARLIAGKGMPLYVRGALFPVLNWLESLPKKVLDERPRLWLIYAGALTTAGQTTSVEQKLQAAEAALQGVEMNLETRDLLGSIANNRAVLAVSQYQSETAIIQAKRSLEYLHPDNLPVRSITSWALGVAYEFQGDRVAAGQAYTSALSISRAIGHSFVTKLATVGLGSIQEAENQLYIAAETNQSALQLFGDQPLPIACHAHLGLARIHYQWNDLDTAEIHVQKSIQLARQFADIIDRFVVSELFLSRIMLTRGDITCASVLLAKVSQIVRQNNFVYRMAEVAEAQVLTLLQQGNLTAAVQLAQTHEIPMSRARVHLAKGDTSAALAVLEPYLRQMEAKGWQDECLKITVLQAVILYAKGEKEKALQTLGDALTRAAPGGFIRIFVDEGIPMAELLSEKAGQGFMPDYTGKLLAAFDAEVLASKNKSYLPPSQPLIEPLSEREMQILQLIARGLSNQEICRKLFLALPTVKGHNTNIFGKLQVQRRTEAIARARELGLL